MILYSILQKQKDNLNFLGNSNENIELAMKTITEFKKHNIIPKNIDEALLNIKDEKLKLKLEDINNIYTSYESTIAENYIDEEDVLTKLEKNLDESKIFENSYIYIDEFAGFTKQEYGIITKLMKKAKQITITLSIDSLENNLQPETDIFYPNKQVAEKIINCAKNAGIKIEEFIKMENVFKFKNEELKHLESNIYKVGYDIYEKNTNDIKLFLATNPYSELEQVAKTIYKLVSSGGIKYSDISIITKNIDSVSSITKAIFSKYNIPIFIDEKEELSNNIFIKYILAILDIFAKGWTHETVFNYIKTGFCDIDKNDIYMLENYCIKWGIKGSKWYKEEWKYGEGPENKEFNDLRKQVVQPVLNLKEKLGRTKTAKDISEAIYYFLEENGIYERLNNKISYLEEHHELQIAENYKKSLEIFFNVLDEIVLIFGQEKISFEKYKELLKIGLLHKDLGTIPQALDQVILGDVDRSKTHKVKIAFIIDVNDGAFPSVNRDEGFLNDNDRTILKQTGYEIAKGTLDALYDEEFNIYKAFCTPEEKLYILYTSSDKEGKALRPSILISKIKKIFPKIQEESDMISEKIEITSKQSTFEELLVNLRKFQDGEKIDKIWFEIYNWYNQNSEWKEKLEKSLKGISYTNKAENISKENIEKLYGTKLKTSISKLEQYKQCPFAFHLKYGLKIKEKDEFKIKSIDTGSFMHEVIDAFFDEIKETDIKVLEKEKIKQIVEKIINEKLLLSKNRIFTSSPKFIILTNRLKKVVTESIEHIVYQMQNSDFKILDSEVEFVQKMDNIEITGKVDRIDIAENEDGKFIRIIDYKSSTKNLDLNHMISGVQIQLLTYIDIVAKQEEKTPAGMLYFNLIEPIIQKNRNLSDEKIEEEIRKSFKMKGLVLSNIKVIKMMDKNLESGYSNIIPVYIDSKGNISESSSSVVTSEQFLKLQKQVRKIIKQISEEILAGRIEIKPLYDMKNKTSACKYCEYKTICAFNSKQNTYEYILNRSKEEILNNI